MEADYSLNGMTRYLPTGETVVVEHIVDNIAYVHPMITIQTTNYQGDDFDEEEVPADHLVTVEVSKLSVKPPVGALAEEVATLKAQIAGLNKYKQDETQALSKTRKDFMDLTNQVRTWKAKNPRFDQIIKLLNGDKVIGVTLPDWTYRLGMPQRIDQADFKVLQLIHIGNGQFKWSGHWKRHGHYNHDEFPTLVEFFESEEQLEEGIKSLYCDVVEAFFKTSEDVMFGSISGTGKMVTYKDLVAWIKEFPFLEMPPMVEDMKSRYEANKKSELVCQTRARLTELEAL